MIEFVSKLTELGQARLVALRPTCGTLEVFEFRCYDWSHELRRVADLEWEHFEKGKMDTIPLEFPSMIISSKWQRRECVRRVGHWKRPQTKFQSENLELCEWNHWKELFEGRILRIQGIRWWNIIDLCERRKLYISEFVNNCFRVLERISIKRKGIPAVRSWKNGFQ